MFTKCKDLTGALVLLTALLYSGSANYCTTLSFQVAVDHNKRIIMCSQAFFGAAGDKLIVKVVNETKALMNLNEGYSIYIVHRRW